MVYVAATERSDDFQTAVAIALGILVAASVIRTVQGFGD